ncbi:hypothetical protein M8C21_009347, partial [Ambrosia artemisiifolia]
SATPNETLADSPLTAALALSPTTHSLPLLPFESECLLSLCETMKKAGGPPSGSGRFDGGAIIFVNNIVTIKGGAHVDYITIQKFVHPTPLGKSGLLRPLILDSPRLIKIPTCLLSFSAFDLFAHRLYYQNLLQPSIIAGVVPEGSQSERRSFDSKNK